MALRVRPRAAALAGVAALWQDDLDSFFLIGHGVIPTLDAGPHELRGDFLAAHAGILVVRIRQDFLASEHQILEQIDADIGELNDLQLRERVAQTDDLIDLVVGHGRNRIDLIWEDHGRIEREGHGLHVRVGNARI